MKSTENFCVLFSQGLFSFSRLEGFSFFWFHQEDHHGDPISRLRMFHLHFKIKLGGLQENAVTFRALIVLLLEHENQYSSPTDPHDLSMMDRVLGESIPGKLYCSLIVQDLHAS